MFPAPDLGPCGRGDLAEGQGFVSLETSGVVIVARDGYAPDPDTAVCAFWHSVPGKGCRMRATIDDRVKHPVTDNGPSDFDPTEKERGKP